MKGYRKNVYLLYGTVLAMIESVAHVQDKNESRLISKLNV